MIKERFNLSRDFQDGVLALCCVMLGDDLSISLVGGQPHVGAAAIAYPYHKGDHISVSVSVLEREGHKDGILGTQIARRISQSTGRVVHIVCGIHFDNLHPDELDRLIGICTDMADELIKEWTV